MSPKMMKKNRQKLKRMSQKMRKARIHSKKRKTKKRRYQQLMWNRRVSTMMRMSNLCSAPRLPLWTSTLPHFGR